MNAADPVRRTGPIIAIPKERLTAETVGDLQKLGDAAYRARQMRDDWSAVKRPSPRPRTRW